MGIMLFFGQKLNTQHSVGRCACKSPVMKWTNALILQKKKTSLKQNAASHNNASRSTDTEGFLEHPPKQGKPVLQGAHPPEDNSILGEGPPYIRSNHYP